MVKVKHTRRVTEEIELDIKEVRSRKELKSLTRGQVASVNGLPNAFRRVVDSHYEFVYSDGEISDIINATLLEIGRTAFTKDRGVNGHYISVNYHESGKRAISDLDGFERLEDNKDDYQDCRNLLINSGLARKAAA